MARGVNKVILVGNLGADPDTRYMPSGKAVTNIRVATSESWKDKQTGDMQERTEWHSGRRGTPDRRVEVRHDSADRRHGITRRQRRPQQDRCQ